MENFIVSDDLKGKLTKECLTEEINIDLDFETIYVTEMYSSENNIFLIFSHNDFKIKKTYPIKNFIINNFKHTLKDTVEFYFDSCIQKEKNKKHLFKIFISKQIFWRNLQDE